MPDADARIVEAADLAAGDLRIAAGEMRSAVIVETAGRRGVLGWIPRTLRVAKLTVDQSQPDVIEVDVLFQPRSAPAEDQSAGDGRRSAKPAKLMLRPEIATDDLFVWVFCPGGSEWAVVVPSEFGLRFKVTIEDGPASTPWKLVSLTFRLGGIGFE